MTLGRVLISQVRLGQCWPRHAADPGLARPSSNPAHRTLYGVKPDAIQRSVALNGRERLWRNADKWRAELAIPTMSGETPQRLNDLTRAAMLLPLTAALLAFALAAKLYLAARGQTNKSATIKRRTNLNNRPMDKL